MILKDEFIVYLESIKKYSGNTIVNYELDLDKFEYYLKIKRKNIKEIEYKDILEYINYLREDHKSTSVNRSLSCLRNYYDFLIRNKKIKNNPFNLVHSMKKEKKLPEYFKYNEYVELVDSIDISNELGIRNRCIFEVLLCTGCRVNELVNINLNNVDINNQEIKVLGKGN